MATNESISTVERVENCSCCKTLLEDLLATNLKMWMAKVKAGSKCFASFEGIYDDTKLMNAIFDCYGQLKFCRECVILHLNISPTNLRKMKDHVKNNPCPYRFRIKNKIRSAHYKLPAKRDFFDYVMKNQRPNTHYDKAGAPMFYLDNRFECIRLPSASDRQFARKAEKSLVWHFNMEQLRHKRQTISSRTAHNWIKSEFPHTALSPTQSWLCIDCKKLRKKEASRIKNLKNESIDSGISVLPPELGCSYYDDQSISVGHYDESHEYQLQSSSLDYNNLSPIDQHRLASNQAMDTYNSLCVQCQLDWAGIQQVATESTQDFSQVVTLGQMKDQFKATLDCDFQMAKTLPHYGFSHSENKTRNQAATQHCTLFNIKEHSFDHKHIYICGDDQNWPIHRCDYIISFLDDYLKYHLPSWIKNVVIVTNRDNRSQALINWLINLTKFGHYSFIQLLFTHPGHGGIATELMTMQFAHKFYGRDIQDVSDLAYLAKEFAVAHVLDYNGIYVWQQLLANYGDGIYSHLNYDEDVYNIYRIGKQTQISHFSFPSINPAQVDQYQDAPPVQITSAHSYAYLQRNNILLPTHHASKSNKKKRTSNDGSQTCKRRSKCSS